MLRFTFLILLLSFFVRSTVYSQRQQQTILAIFAHSDDETAVGQVLARYAREAKVYVMYVVDVGDSSRIAGWPTGDTMKQIRRNEAICACSVLGVQPPIFLGFDRLDGRNGVRTYFQRTNKVKAVLTHQIDSLKPDVLITFGPDGETGHFEHRIVSGLVTEVILLNGWVERFPLCYLGRPKLEKPSDDLEGIGEVDKKYLNTTVKFSDKDEATLFEAAKCYKSQFKLEEILKWKEEEISDTSNVFYFRQLVVPLKRKSELFEK